jgi:hypothetical protein
MPADLRSWIPTLILVPLIGFLLYRRARSSFGEQRIVVGRMVLRMVLLGVVTAVVLATARTTWGFAAAGAGAILGVVLARVALVHTHVAVNAAGPVYTPNKWIGIGITALFLGRLGARFFTVYRTVATAQPGAQAPFDVQRSPLTAGIIFLMAGYYIAYYAGILVKSRAITAPPPSPPAPS